MPSPASNTPSSSHDLRDSYYYGGDLKLRWEEDGYESAESFLEWSAYQGGFVSLRIDYWELGRLIEAAEQIRAEMRSCMDWLDKT